MAGRISEVTVPDRLPPESQRIAELAEQQPPQIQEVYQFMLAVAMEESGIAKLINTVQIDGHGTPTRVHQETFALSQGLR